MGNQASSNETCLRYLDFEPGFIGIAIYDEDGVVTSVDEGSQGERLGVKVGWQLCKVEGSEFSTSRLEACIDGQKNYSVAFKVVACEEACKRTCVQPYVTRASS